MSSWQDLATQEATTQQCDLSIVLATIEAEGARNVTGDNGNAVGYGQVWFKWHPDAFQYASNRFGLPAPNSLEEATAIALGNDQYSMAVAVYVIKRNWIGSGKNWDKFTEFYVGKGIPDKDRERRRVIWHKYSGISGTTFDTSTGATEKVTSTGYAGQSSQDIKGTYIGESNFIADLKSINTGNRIYGRRCRVLISNAKGVALDVSELKVTFNIIKTFQLQANYSEVSIYNLSAETENQIIKEGDRIVIEAGYEGSQYGVIFDGNVVGFSRSKEGGVSYKLTIWAQDADMFITRGFIGFTYKRGQTLRQVATNIMSKATHATQIGDISESLDNAKLTRGKTVFGSAASYLRQIAQSDNSTFHIEDGVANIVNVASVPKGRVIELSPSSGLMNSPTQKDNGMSCQVFLNPQIKINTLVHIDNTLIQEMLQVPGTYYRELDKAGIYRVIKLTHVGDTYGDNWYTEIETITQAGYLPSMIVNSNQNPW